MGNMGWHGMIDDSHKINSEMCIFVGTKGYVDQILRLVAISL